MSYVDRAIGYVLKNEVGYVNHPADPGGETNYGITKRGYPNLDITNLTKAEAIQIYHRDYWHPAYDRLVNEGAAIKLFDMAVNMGHKQAVKLLQRAIGVTDDGIIGPVTIRTANNTLHLIELLCQQQAAFYSMLVAKRPSLQPFLRGWHRRAAWYPPKED